jgi:hypothetical protein
MNDTLTKELKIAAQAFVRALLSSVHKYSPKEDRRPIFIYSSRRGGSTLMLEVLASSPGMSFSDQPLTNQSLELSNLRQIPLYRGGQIIDPTPSERSIMLDYLQELISGQTRACGPWRFWRSHFHRKADRLILKIVDAKLMLPDCVEAFGGDHVVLLRHPIAQAISVIRWGWTPTYPAYLDNVKYIESHLTSEQQELAFSIAKNGGQLERHVLDWCLENRPLIGMTGSLPQVKLTTYEHLVTAPEVVCKALAEAMGIDSVTPLLEQISRPSVSARFAAIERQKSMQSGNSSGLIETWMRHVSPEQQRSCDHILSVMNVGIYNAYEAMPTFADDGSIPGLIR